MGAQQPKVNGWVYLSEDEPPGSSYKTPDSSYQNLTIYRVYESTDMVSICWVNVVATGPDTIPVGDGSTFTVQLEAKQHPDGSTNQQYMDWLIQDTRAINPNVKLLVMLGYGATELTQIYTGGEAAANAFAANLVQYLENYGLDGFDVDWESPLSDNGTSAQFATLFSAIRTAFQDTGRTYYLVLSPAEVGTLDASTVNSAFDFVNLQLYSGFTCPEDFISEGVDASKLAYGAKFEPNGGIPYENAQQAYAFWAPSCRTKMSYPIWTNWRLNSNNFQYEQAQQQILHQLVYGDPGPGFDDAPIVGCAGNPPVSQVVVRSGEVLDALQATNTGSFDGNSVGYILPQHGGDGESTATVSIDPGDVIAEIAGYTGIWFGWPCVLQITITTRNGSVHGPFGTMSNASSQSPFSFTAPPGQSILAFSGSVVNVPLAGGGNTDIIASLNVAFG